MSQGTPSEISLLSGWRRDVRSHSLGGAALTSGVAEAQFGERRVDVRKMNVQRAKMIDFLAT